MSAEIVNLDVVTTLPLPVGRIIAAAEKADLDHVIVIGIKKDGDFYFAASEPDGGTNLWWLEIAKKRLLAIGDSQ